ncbi:sensor histidine kinase, partial [Micromonospora aurantiaca (nom. illeg.)]
MTRPGLRARVTAAFAVGALLLSALMALFSYDLTRRSLLDERERTAVRAAYYDAAVVRSGLDTGTPDVVAVLRSLDTGSARRPLLHLPDGWYARTADVGASSVPVELQRVVADGKPAVQRIRLDGQPVLLVGVPLPGALGYYELTSLREVEETFQVVGLALIAVAIMVAGAGAALGWYATRHSLRPLTAVADAAERIAAGDFATRLDPTTDPDLTRLSSSFNEMVDKLVHRIERDRRFAADVSHELRSPLQTLAAAASVLHRRREHQDERTATAAGLVADEVTRFQRLVDDLIQLARTEQPAHRETVDVLELARTVCRERSLPESLVTVEGDAPRLWWVDRRRFAQTLLNLVENAERYGGGPVAVRLGGRDGVGVLEVDDDGPGVPPGDREIIFDRFVRGRAA